MESGTRRLVAIMFSDIAGYTSLMGEDEDLAIRVLERSREIVRAQVEKHGGRLLEEIGDGTLSSFDSAVSAVECSRDIQEIVGADPDFDLRIGIHIGDVLLSGDQVIGDGVNVASRIHGLADPGATCISDRVYDHVRNHPGLEAWPLGERDLKNVSRSVMVYILGTPLTTLTPPPDSSWGRRLAIAAAVVAVLAGGLWATGAFDRALVFGLVNLPRLMGSEVESEIGFVSSADGTRIAYAVSGEGPAIVHVLGWATHVERGLNSPAYNPSIAHFAERFQYVRYDGRGSGLSDRAPADFSLEARVADLEAVIDGLGLDRVVLFALSAGGFPSLVYTVRHPEKVRRLVLIATAASAPSVKKAQPLWNSIPDMIRGGWGADDSSAIGVFTSLIIPDASPLQQDIMNEMFSTAMTGEDAARFLEVLINGEDQSSLLSQIAVPTLVIHARGDRLVPFEAGGRELAAGIPGAKLVVLETDNHGFGPTDPTYGEYLQALDDFLAEDPELAERY
jgi:class 3 adenylate cyclase/pimeloyl-ACP methyl ester carboxylesterase